MGHTSRAWPGYRRFISVSPPYSNVGPQLISIQASSLGPIDISTLHHLRSLHFIITFLKLTPNEKPFDQTLSLVLQLSNRPNTLEKITVKCHWIQRHHTYKESLVELWRPLDTALSAMSNGEPVFGKLKEVEIVLSASAIPAAEIHEFMMRQQSSFQGSKHRGRWYR